MLLALRIVNKFGMLEVYIRATSMRPQLPSVVMDTISPTPSC